MARRVLGVGRQQSSLDEALAVGAIDEALLDAAGAARRSDLVVFCTPVDRIGEQMLEAAATCKEGAIFTDAGSTKRAIVQAAEAELPNRVRFVGGHPLAGSEKKSIAFAHADLFVDRWTVLTPTANTPVTALDTVGLFWRALGARVRTMAPADHDVALALTSHLPHLVAAALAGLLPQEMHDLTATGFRDTTRVASGDPCVWTPIFQQNRAAVLAALDQLETRLRHFRAALETHDLAQIDSLLTQGKKVRDALGS